MLKRIVFMVWCGVLVPAMALAAVRFVDNTTTSCSTPSDTDYDPNTETCGSGSFAVYTNPQAGLAASSAGDTLYIRAGTYTDTLASPTARLYKANWTGSSSQRITVSGYGTERPTLASQDRGIVTDGQTQYVTIENMVISGVNHVRTDGLSNFIQGATGMIFRNLEITGWRGMGLYMTGVNDIQILNSVVHDQNIEWSGCVAGKRYLAFYLHDGNNVVVRGNETYGNGGGMQAYPGPIANIEFAYNNVHDETECDNQNVGGFMAQEATGEITGVKVHHNRMRAIGATAGAPANAIEISAAAGKAVTGAFIYSNSVSATNHNGSNGCGIFIGTNSSATVADNLVPDNEGGAICGDTSLSTLTNNACKSGESCGSTNKLTVAAITTCTVSTTDYTQKTGSTCINAGTAVTGLLSNGTADIGATETFNVSGASIDTNIMDVTFGMSTHVPLLPSTGMTGFSVNCTGTGCGTPVIDSAVRLSGSDSVVRLRISGITGDACDPGQTWTVSYTPGNVTDSALIGNTINQPLLAFTNQAVTETCSGTPTPPPTADLTVDYLTDENTGTNVESQVNSPAKDGTLTGSPLPTWTTGRDGFALSYAAGINQYLAVPFGSGWNPTTTSLTACGETLPHDAARAQTIFFSTDNGTSQRAYVGQIGGTWGIGIQGSSFSTGSEFPVVAEWTVWCLRFDKDTPGGGTGTAELFINGVKGTSAQAKKTYTSYTFASDFRVGLGDFDLNFGGSTSDRLKIFSGKLSDQDIADLVASWAPPATPPSGDITVPSWKFKKPRRKADSSAEDANGLNADLKVRPGGYFGLEFQIDAENDNPAAFAARLFYSVDDGATWLAVPDVCDANQICFYGDNGDASLINDAIDYRLSGAFTIVNGSTQLTASAIPNVDLCEDCSVVLRYIIKVGDSATPGTVVQFKLRNQTGLDFTHTPATGAGIEVMRVSAGM